MTTTAPPNTWHVRPVLLVAAAGVAVHLAVGAGYGWFRDELYFVAESHHLAWGFSSEPPFSAALAWVSRQLFGDALAGLRLWPALAGAGVAILAALVARELGGRLVAQLTAAIAVSTATILLGLFHVFGPTAFDQLAWAGCLFVLVRILNGADPRWWLAFGAIAGAGLLTKNTLVFLALALLVAVALDPDRRQWLRSPWPWLGGLLAVAIASPYLVWQTLHGWPMLRVAGTISADHGGLAGAPQFLLDQLLTMNPLLAPLWLAGLWWLWRSGTYRLLAWVFLLLVALLALVGGRSYYLAPAFLPLFAAGGVAVERRLRRPGWVPAALVVAAAVVTPSALPVLPVAWHRDLPFATLNPLIGDAIGWPQLVAQVTAPSLPVLAGNYGEAGAVEQLGEVPAYSGHNAYGDWGPPPEGTDAVVAVGFRHPELLKRSFAEVSVIGRVDNGVGVPNEEQGQVIYLCRGPVRPWAQLWPDFRYASN